MYTCSSATSAPRYNIAMPLLTVLAEAFIALLVRLVIYLLPMLAGVLAATATEKIIEKKRATAKKRAVQRRAKAIVQ